MRDGTDGRLRRREMVFHSGQGWAEHMDSSQYSILDMTMKLDCLTFKTSRQGIGRMNVQQVYIYANGKRNGIQFLLNRKSNVHAQTSPNNKRTCGSITQHDCVRFTCKCMVAG